MQKRVVLDTFSDKEPVDGALLPCLIKYNGAAPVADYFTPIDLPATKETAGGLPEPSKEAYFRGRKLLGTPVKLPAGYKALLFDASGQTESRAVDSHLGDDSEMEEIRTFKAQTELRSLTVYGNAAAPDAATPQLKIEAWLALAKVIHNA